MQCIYEAEFTTKCALKRTVGLTRLKMQRLFVAGPITKCALQRAVSALGRFKMNFLYVALGPQLIVTPLRRGNCLIDVETQFCICMGP